MLIEVKQILPDGTMIIKFIKFTGEFPEKLPIEREQYTTFFETVKPDPIPEFNQ